MSTACGFRVRTTVDECAPVMPLEGKYGDRCFGGEDAGFRELETERGEIGLKSRDRGARVTLT